ncbi:MAG TPA: hypothetical protein VMU54_16355 [Planctomycetota bacterium]|nr:hypothetical protein [Planctomycetota bacterium]
MNLRSLLFCLVVAPFLSCSTTTPEMGDPLDVLGRIESWLLEAPELDVHVRYDHRAQSMNPFIEGKESRESTSGRYVVRRGMIYWVLDPGKAGASELPQANLKMFQVPGTSAAPPAEKAIGQTLIDFLHPWSVADPLVGNLYEEHILATSLQTAFLADARLGQDGDGPYVICRFRIQELCYPLAQQLWKGNYFGGAEMGPPQALTGTAEHQLWYDPVTFSLRKRSISGECILDGGIRHFLPSLTELYRVKSSGEKR